MKTCLAQGFLFAFGLNLYKSFDKAGTTGVVPMPDASEQSRTEHGRHSMLAVGYRDKLKVFIVRNSWGTDWGDQGYCYIPYDYITNPAFSHEVWTVRTLETDDMGEEDWDDDDDDEDEDDDGGAEDQEDDDEDENDDGGKEDEEDGDEDENEDDEGAN